MKVYEALVAALAAERIGPIFGLMGDGVMSLWGVIGRTRSATIVDARHEAGAVAMADGYFRATGSVGVTAITCGPGLTQIGTSLMAAARNRSAIVVLAGQAAAQDRASLQYMDQRRFIEACSARSHAIASPQSLAEDIAEAFFAARVHRCPVVLNLPMDIQEMSFDWDWEYRPSLEFLPPPAESSAGLEAIAQKLLAAERPIIIAGRGAKIAGAKNSLVALADYTGALLATSLQAKGMFSDQAYDLGISGAYVCAPAEELFAKADFVLGVGAELGYYTCEGGLLFPEAEIARIDIAPGPQQIGTVPGLYVQGDARRSAERLLAQVSTRSPRKAAFRTRETDAILARQTATVPRANDGIDPRELMHNLSDALPQNVLITCGVGHFLGFVAMHLSTPKDGDIQFSGQFGAIGQTLPVAIGIGLADRNRPHILIEGDGSLMMNMQELDTAARCGLQMIIIVLNDSGFGAEMHKLRAKGFDQKLAQWPSPDFVGLARAMGGDGIVIEEASAIQEAVRRGLNLGGVFLIDARISPSSVSDAYLKLHFGVPNAAPRLRLPAGR